MTTFADLVNEVYLTLEGWGLNNGRAAFITTSTLTSGGLSFTVDSAENIGAGVVEIEDELVYVQSVSGTTVTIAPDGRGYRGTTAASHAVGARVTMNPVVPRVKVKKAINETIAGVYPTLRATATEEVTTVGYQRAYELPAAVEQVLKITYQASGPTGIWPEVTHYDYDLFADTTEFPSGKSLMLIGPFEVGHTVRVTYVKRPTELVNDADVLATVSGLNDSASALIVAGALWRIAVSFPISILRNDSAVTDYVDGQQSKSRDAAQVAMLLRQRYEQELREEAARQHLSHSVPIYWTE